MINNSVINGFISITAGFPWTRERRDYIYIYICIYISNKKSLSPAEVKIRIEVDRIRIRPDKITIHLSISNTKSLKTSKVGI